MNINDEKLKIIDTQVIPKLKVFDSKNIELIGWGGSITGVENEQDLDFEITFAGINHETLQNTFPEHYSAYYE